MNIRYYVNSKRKTIAKADHFKIMQASKNNYLFYNLGRFVLQHIVHIIKT